MMNEVILDNLTPAQKLATAIHNKTCHWNHADGCSWCYESWNDKVWGYTKSRYLEKAKKILEKTEFETAMYVISCL